MIAADGPGMITLDDIKAAQAAIRGAIVPTPCLWSQTLSSILGAEIFLKFENQQFTASFKERGALNKLLALTPDEWARGVIAASAGNHAQGLAYHASRAGVHAVIVMPRHAPEVKIRAVRNFGAEAVLHGRNFDEAAQFAHILAGERGLTLVHPFDDPLVIAGQGTIALEMLAAVPDLDVLLVPVGGGGLIAGIATAAKALRPQIDIIGVQSEFFPAMAVATGHSCDPRVIGGASVAEGIAVEAPGRLTSAIVERLVDDMLVVHESTIEDAIAMLLEIEKTLCEGAGAVGIAALMEQPARFVGRRIGVVLSGGNIDIHVLSAALERSLMRRGRIVRLAVTTLDASGSLAEIARVIADASGNIRQVGHDRIFTNRGAKSATITFEIELADESGAETIRKSLEAKGMTVTLGESPAT
jgi:threonine dehydratase